eukprot:10777041-Ditylum_brightwellii.AAC.1
MHTPLILGDDAGSNKMINMLRVMSKYPAPVNDKGCMRYKTLNSLHNTDIEVNSIFNHVLFDEKK